MPRMLGLNLIDAGHFYTENPVVRRIWRKKSRGAVPGHLTVKISQTHAGLHEILSENVLIFVTDISAKIDLNIF